MKDKLKVIQIKGISGIILAVFIVGCALTGFLIFPAWCCMNIWNLIAETFYLPKMLLGHGVMLWLIIALIIYAINQQQKIIAFRNVPTVSDADIKKMLEQIKEKKISTIKQDIETNENLSNKKEN